MLVSVNLAKEVRIIHSPLCLRTGFDGASTRLYTWRIRSKGKGALPVC